MGGSNTSSVNGSSREYTLTGLEENSDFAISITAMNGAGSSPPANTTARTAIAGELDISYRYHVYNELVLFQLLPFPQNI